ncbi:MAG: hypothetical protein JXN64_08775 [Spirochaetes bacterium]|nr:hypothetical protein [Spirochaetota bacterium]
MHKPSESANRIAELIKKAIADHVVTSAEFDEIMAIADEDGILDQQEKRLLAELHEMMRSGAIKRKG